MFVLLVVTSMQQIFRGSRSRCKSNWVALYLPQRNEVYEINAFYAEMFSFFISRGHLNPISHRGSKCRLRQLVK